MQKRVSIKKTNQLKRDEIFFQFVRRLSLGHAELAKMTETKAFLRTESNERSSA